MELIIAVAVTFGWDSQGGLRTKEYELAAHGVTWEDDVDGWAADCAPINNGEMAATHIPTRSTGQRSEDPETPVAGLTNLEKRDGGQQF